jgi:ribosomal protein S18 acetylase RimI-like enzyme
MTWQFRLIDGAAAYVDAAALIWAEATARRDGDAEAAPLELARPIIQRVLDGSPHAFLPIVLAGETTAAFAVIAPVGEVEDREAEIHYLGVAPAWWGRGVGGFLLKGVVRELKARNFAHARLFVYADNPAAVRLYERMGWQLRGEGKVHPRSGRIEREYRLTL